MPALASGFHNWLPRDAAISPPSWMGCPPPGMVKTASLQVCGDDAVASEQAHHLPGGQDHVRAGASSGVAHGGQLAFRFLGHRAEHLPGDLAVDRFPV